MIKDMPINPGHDEYMLREYTAIGKRGLRRLDGLEKANGKAIYTRDVTVRGMLYAKILISPYPHARIKNIDTSKAENIPGVKYMLKYDDPEVKNCKVLHGEESDIFDLLSDTAYFEGQPLGVVVAAESEEIAEQALEALDIEWEQRPFVLDPEEALKPGAPLARPDLNPNDNKHGLYDLWYYDLHYGPKEWPVVFKHGDVEKGLREADTVIEFEAKKQNHTYAGVEAISCLAKWLGDNLEIWIHHQCPDVAKKELSESLRIPLNKIKIYCLYQGGMFGGWAWISWSYAIHILTAMLAKRTDKPVKLVLSARESHFYSANMDAATHQIKVGAKKDGMITAVQIKGRFFNGPPKWIPYAGMDQLLENTSIPNLYLENTGAFVNVWPNGSYRCEQTPSTLCINLVFNRIADALGLDPTEVALKNDGTHGKGKDYLVELKQKGGFPDRDSLVECIQAGKERIGWDEKWHKPGQKMLPNGKYHGLGFCWSQEWLDTAGSGFVTVTIEIDGSVSLLTQRADVGVSAETTYAQIAADELGVNYEDVNLRPFYDVCMFMGVPGGSWNCVTNGYLSRKAARKAKWQLLELATKNGAYSTHSYDAPFAGMQPEELDVKNSFVYVKAAPSKKVSVKEVVKSIGNHGFGPSHAPVYAYAWHTQGIYLAEAGSRPPLCRQAHFMEVEVDPETGEVEITRVVNVNDVGKVINPDACEGQQYGGMYMAVGRNKLEEMIWDPQTGVKLNANLLDYKVPTMLDCGPIDTILLESGLGRGPYGSVGIGEDVATLPDSIVGPAVHNAIGKWISDYPITPDKVLKALGKI